MNPEHIQLFGSLARVERALRFLPDQFQAVHSRLLRTMRLSEHYVAAPVVKRAVPPQPGRPLPAPPRARPLMVRLLRQYEEPPPHVPRRDPVPEDALGERLRQASGARALLLEIFRRAAYDWVLYRASSRLDQKRLAEDAHHWLFVEEDEGPVVRARRDSGKVLTSFAMICESLDLDQERLRRHVKSLTPGKVMSSGRPPENSRASEHSPNLEIHMSVPDRRGEFDFDALINHMLDLD